MSYSREISSKNPACILFLVDQSSSMSMPFGLQPDKRKADGVADAINRLIYTLVIKCAAGKDIRERFYVGVVGYGRDVKSALGGELEGQGLVRISKLAKQPLRMEQRTQQIPDGAGGIVEKTIEFPIWLESIADGKTPMRDAFNLALKWVIGFLENHPDCFPPIVINLSDGAADPDQNPTAAAAAVQQLRSSDGETLVFNINISAQQDAPIMFPSEDSALPNEHARQLFAISSILPENFIDIAGSEGFRVNERSRGFAFNADLVAVIKFLNIGTRPAVQAKG